MKFSSRSSICQYVGSKYDPATPFAYPSLTNHCFNCQVPAVPSLEHQGAFCLTLNHTDCPVFTQPETKPFPKNIMAANMQDLPGRRPIWQFIVLAAGIFLAGFVFWLGFQSFSAEQIPAIQPSIPRATSSSLTPSLMPTKVSLTPPLTNTPTPTPSPEPSPTTTEFPPQIHALDVPVLVGEQSILLHRIREGEQIVSLLKDYQTTIEVLQAINHLPLQPLFLDQVIIIAPGLQVVDPNLPSFEPYQVTDKEISIENLAGKLGVDLPKLKYYNRCSNACPQVKGNWLLLPPAINTPIPATPTPEPSLTPALSPAKFHTLDVPFMVGKQPILIHRIMEWEQAILLVDKYQTSIEVLQEINYIPAVPLLKDQVIVIAPGLIINLDPELPALEPYQVTEKEISIEALAQKLSVDLSLLKYYNACSDGCRLVKGDWLLIAHPK